MPPHREIEHEALLWFLGRLSGLYRLPFDAELITQQFPAPPLTCMRYIELNPVRASMVQDPAQYRWSSYRHNELGQVDTRITSYLIFLAHDRDGAERQAA